MREATFSTPRPFPADGVGGPDEAWCADITYIRVGKGFVCLVAAMDWETRAAPSWKVPNTLGTAPCLEAFRDAVRRRRGVLRCSTTIRTVSSRRRPGAIASRGPECA